jgi:hypothetical protein
MLPSKENWCCPAGRAVYGGRMDGRHFLTAGEYLNKVVFGPAAGLFLNGPRLLAWDASIIVGHMYCRPQAILTFVTFL